MDKNTRYIKQGLLAEKKQSMSKLEIQADRCRKDVNIYLFSSDGIKGMEFEHAKQAFEELTQVVEEYKRVTEEIKRIENEL
ncbi:MAG: hypothetical protein DWB56_14835 [Candidatus Jettenia sp.]|uniref:Uncharacterized protein n=1 Tax=Candidatus Jettenia caeni TaxID=247490 RepID=I3ILR9_9BACT|nr:hypothetical protein [Candidatus Jettenia sp. AMX1]KAA0243580.1 MAG: hypothetical protein EDM70_10010 [Candidatus Brocadia sp. AMX2]MBC6930208.1 hypothetical protein [Candidatus Jettenia sp.]GAB62664.1 hypothetical protein KSU1_C1068 [Candidatus Jettenia caeni]MCQ3927082.1 hypothetical protein [Candidatus Jettenia sp.]MDL1939894.1 hypothetical protein [Candidatus Jettenia sp. AMX1]